MKIFFRAFFLSLLVVMLLDSIAVAQVDRTKKPRARDIGLNIGILPTGPLNMITDVRGVKVGHSTIIQGKNIRTGVTAILPHGGNLFREKVPGAIFVGNGFGKLMGSTQVEELGEIETPILLTSTLAVPKVANFLMDYMLALPGNENVRSINPVVAETNDGYLNDIRARPITYTNVLESISKAKSGKIAEGTVGAGTGTLLAFGWKGGIGTSSRKLPQSLGGYTVGVLVQTNFGGVLTIDGAPVGIKLGKYYLRRHVESKTGRTSSSNDLNDNADGSIIIVIATDAPINARNLKRIAARSMMGLARTGAAGTNGSGDYAIAFSTALNLRTKSGSSRVQPRNLLPNNLMSPLFLATIEATEEAIYNSLFQATSVTGNKGNTIKALPLSKTIDILKNFKKIN